MADSAILLHLLALCSDLKRDLIGRWGRRRLWLRATTRITPAARPASTIVPKIASKGVMPLNLAGGILGRAALREHRPDYYCRSEVADAGGIEEGSHGAGAVYVVVFAGVLPTNTQVPSARLPLIRNPSSLYELSLQV